MAQHLSIPRWDEEKADVKRLIQNYLSHDTINPWIMIFDNADDISI
jgi:hypothetical protein